MKRRDILTALGAVATAGAATVGTGAFTSVSADRGVQVSVADDASALLRLVPVPGSGNSPYVEIEDGQLTIDISDSNDDVLGDGVNADAITVFDDLFRIENQGTQTVYVWLLESGGRTGSKWHAFYVGSWLDGGDAARAISLADFNNGVGRLKGDGRQRQPQFDAGIETAAVELDVGEHVDVGLVVDTPPGSAGSAVLKDGQTVTINANADEGDLADVFTPAYDPGGE
jgi:hypothetical protein